MWRKSFSTTGLFFIRTIEHLCGSEDLKYIAVIGLHSEELGVAT